MKYYETSFYEYINSCKKQNLHKNIEPLFFQEKKIKKKIFIISI